MIIVVENTWEGHTPTYFKAIVEVLLLEGKAVCAACPEPEEVRNFLAVRLPSPVLVRLHLLRLNHFDLGMKGGSKIKAVFNRTCMCLRTVRRLREWSEAGKHQVELIFFNLLEPYLNSLGFLALRSCPAPWTGVYMHPFVRSMQGRQKTCIYKIRGTTLAYAVQGRGFVEGLTLDEGSCAELKRITGREFYMFPDITDETDPAQLSPLARQVKEWAAGRPIVALLGGQTRRKGSFTLLEAARGFDPQSVCFVFAGGFRAAEAQRELKEFKLKWESKPMPHVFLHLEALPDGAEFNSMVKISDVLYCCYENFPHSSNILTKAALFRKRVLVPDVGLMSERCRTYGLGESASPGDVRSVTIQLNRLLSMTRERPGVGLRSYSEMHSVSRLRSVMNSLTATS